MSITNGLLQLVLPVFLMGAAAAPPAVPQEANCPNQEDVTLGTDGDACTSGESCARAACEVEPQISCVGEDCAIPDEPEPIRFCPVSPDVDPVFGWTADTLHPEDAPPVDIGGSGVSSSDVIDDRHGHADLGKP